MYICIFTIKKLNSKKVEKKKERLNLNMSSIYN